MRRLLVFQAAGPGPQPDRINQPLHISSSSTVGYNDFDKLVLQRPRPLMVAKFNSKAHLQKKVFPFFPAVSSAFVFKVWKKMQYGYKKSGIWFRFRIRWKICKKSHAEKLLTKKLQKNGVFYFYYCVQKFSDYNFFQVIFCWNPYRIFETIIFCFY